MMNLVDYAIIEYEKQALIYIAWHALKIRYNYL